MIDSKKNDALQGLLTIRAAFEAQLHNLECAVYATRYNTPEFADAISRLRAHLRDGARSRSWIPTVDLRYALKRVRELCEFGMCLTYLAVDEYGDYCPPNSDAAVGWSIVGAAMRTAYERCGRGSNPVLEAVVRAKLFAVLAESGASWPHGIGRSHSDLLADLDIRIAFCDELLQGGHP